MRAKHWLPYSKRLIPVMGAAVRAWLSHRAASKGAALAYYTLFSIAPILVLVIAIAGYVYGVDAAQGRLMAELRSLVGPQGAEAISLVLAGARDKQGGVQATLIATALLVFGATSVFAELKASLDDIWDLPAPPQAGWWDMLRTRLLSFSLILVLAFLLMVSLVVSALMGVLNDYLNGLWREMAVLLSWLASLTGFLVIALLFAVIYKMLPRATLSWPDVAIGALGTAALFTVGKFLIGLYIGNSGVASSYGAAGSTVALLLWVYYSAQIFFLGAEFARQYALQLGSLSELPSAPGSPTKVTRLR